MTRNPFAPPFNALPETLSIFPLEGVLLLPTGQLPLNIFEPRYLDMLNDALAGNRMIGMVQPLNGSHQTSDVFKTGCAGRITEFNETPDGRYLIILTGICRFHIKEELELDTAYRRIQPDWSAFEKDMDSTHSLDLDRNRLTRMLKTYFHTQDIECDWNMVEEVSDNRLITCLSMICPFEAKEKQALLEAPCCRTRASLFMTMLEMAVCEQKGCNNRH